MNRKSESIRRMVFAGCVGLSLSGAASAATVYVADPVADAVYSVDSVALGAAPTLLSCTSSPVVGSGPAFEALCAIAVSPNGLLYTLDGFGDDFRVMNVNKSTGERTEVFTLSGAGWFPQFWIREDGKFLFIKTGLDPVAPSVRRIVELVEATPSGGGAASLVVRAQGQMTGLPFDGALVGNQLRLLLPQVYGAWVLGESGATLTATPDVRLATTNSFTPLVSPDPAGWDFAFNVSQSRPAESTLFILGDVAGSGSGRTVVNVTIDPAGSGGALAGQVGSKHSSYSFGGTVGKESSTRIPSTTGTSPSGVWTGRAAGTLSVPPFSPNSSTLPFEASLWAMPAPKSYLIADRPAGALFVAECFPANITQVDGTSGAILSRLSMSPPPASGIDAGMMSRLSDLALSGNSALVALEEDARILRVNTVTGASEMVTTGRPAALAVPPGGFPAHSPIKIAVTSGGASEATAGWDSY